ncbi:hypothetical protein KRR55_14205 [Paeniglutamicibacter sp. ABSL32-1]|uniref:PP2C family protein-serine/threonine phosphatase n=1 Tax=Paeniglutamicibacter quisquiliarum TaxID=2849498 RepID=UPI001C2D2103|nr:serine/threonine-protein phosphatase [Paeniglutamicibacter quisquiliarum]MBV1780266.1 hypothetical protein [Paeniglutamicibacter quisquiliarum]
MDFGFGQVRAAAATDIGLRRAVNEDSVLDAGTVFAVADGMGGHEAGDLASRLGIETLNEIAAGSPDPADPDRVPADTAENLASLPHARDVLALVTQADARIRRATGARGGTTLCALALVRVEDEGGAWPGDPAGPPPTAQMPTVPRAGSTEALHLPLPGLGVPRYLDSIRESGDVDQSAEHPAEAEPTTDVLPRAQARAVPAAPAGATAMTVAGTSSKVTPIPGAGAVDAGAEETPVRLMLLNVGDSRGYRLREGVLTQLTRDHSAVQELIDAGIITEAEARIHPQRNLITRALGAGGNSVPDTQFHLPRPGDRYLLCTDGLTGEVEHAAMEEILARTPDRTEAVGRLIDAALASGGRDNISVVIIDIEGPGA